MSRTELINKLIKELGFTSYLEIGVQERQNFDKIVCKYKLGVEPNFTYDGCVRMTSDVFFSQCKDKYNLIFIDGDHSFHQSYKDIVNALNFITDRGVIVCHDVLPLDAAHTNPYLNGEVYKAIAKFRHEYPFKMWTYNHDHGCGVITKLPDEKAKETVNTWIDFQNNKHIYNITDDADIIVSACLR